MLCANSKIIVEHQDLSEDFKNISKVISISILYFNLGLGDDYIYYGKTEFKGINTGNKFVVKKRVNISETLEPKYKFIEKKIFPEYYLITVERYKNIVRKRIDEWIYMIKNNEVKDGSTSKNIDKAKQKLAKINMNVEQLKAYDKYLTNLAKDRDVVNTAKEEGKDERNIEIAKKMKIKGKPIAEIIEFTGLLKEQIDEL